MNQYLRVGLAQIAPVWLNKENTLQKIYAAISEAAQKKCDLVVYTSSKRKIMKRQ
jgi:nitrilase